MKRIAALTFVVLIAHAAAALAASYYARGAINYSNGSVATTPGGSVSVACTATTTSDLIDANGNTVTIDVNPTCGTLQTTSGTNGSFAVSGGSVTIANTLIDNCSVGHGLNVSGGSLNFTGAYISHNSTGAQNLSQTGGNLNFSGSFLNYGNGAGIYSSGFTFTGTGTNYSGTCLIEAGGNFSVSGTLLNVGGTSCLYITPGVTLTMSGGQLLSQKGFAAVYNNNGTFNWTGNTSIPAGYECTVNANNRPVVCTGLNCLDSGNLVFALSPSGSISGGTITRMTSSAGVAVTGGTLNTLTLTGPVIPSGGNVNSSSGTFGYAGSPVTATATLPADSFVLATSCGGPSSFGWSGSSDTGALSVLSASSSGILTGNTVSSAGTPGGGLLTVTGTANAGMAVTVGTATISGGTATALSLAGSSNQLSLSGGTYSGSLYSGSTLTAGNVISGGSIDLGGVVLSGTASAGAAIYCSGTALSSSLTRLNLTGGTGDVSVFGGTGSATLTTTNSASPGYQVQSLSNSNVAYATTYGPSGGSTGTAPRPGPLSGFGMLLPICAVAGEAMGKIGVEVAAGVIVVLAFYLLLRKHLPKPPEESKRQTWREWLHAKMHPMTLEDVIAQVNERKRLEPQYPTPEEIPGTLAWYERREQERKEAEARQ